VFSGVRGRSLSVALLAGIIAFTFQATMVKHFAVNVPFWDEWNALVEFVARYAAGSLQWSDLVAPHMEHRPVMSRLAFMLVYRLFGEASLLGCLLFSALLMGLIAGIWGYTLERLGEPRWLLAASLPILLSVAQFENMIWAFQICFYTLVLPVIAAVCFLAVAPRVSWPALCGLAVACAISTFSIASGMLSWGVIGAVLCLRARLESSSFRDMLRRREIRLRLAAFGAMAAVTAVAYLWGYAPVYGSPGPGTGTAIVVRYAGMAFVYPMLDWKDPSQDVLLPAAVAVVAVPIVVACWWHWRRRDRGRFLLMAGLFLMVVTNIGLMAYARGLQLWIAGYYGTVLVWSSVISVMGVADLLRAVRGGPRAWWKAPVLGLLGLTAVLIVGGQLSAYPRAFRTIHDYRAVRVIYEHNVLTLLSTASADRAVPEQLPFPAGSLGTFLADPLIVRVLPARFRPLVARVDLADDAWTVDGVPPSIQRPPGYLVLGSWSGSDAHTGTLKAVDIPRSGLTLLVAGYPSNAGNSLRVEGANDASPGPVFPGPDPGERWVEWRLDPADMPRGPATLVAVDGASGAHGWLAIGLPVPEKAAGRWLRVFFDWIELEGAVALLAGAVCVWLSGPSRESEHT
jgi:hypothetical protein